MPREAMTGGPTREIAGELRGGYVGVRRSRIPLKLFAFCFEPPRRFVFSSGLGSAKSSNLMAL